MSDETERPVSVSPRRGNFTVALGGSTTDAGPGFKVDGETAEVTFFGGADPHDPDFWRKVYALPDLATPNWENNQQCYMVVKLVERIHRHMNEGPGRPPRTADCPPEPPAGVNDRVRIGDLGMPHLRDDPAFSAGKTGVVVSVRPRMEERRIMHDRQNGWVFEVRLDESPEKTMWFGHSWIEKLEGP